MGTVCCGEGWRSGPIRLRLVVCYPGLPTNWGAGIRLHTRRACPSGHNLARSACKFPAITKEWNSRRHGCKTLHEHHQPLNTATASDFMIPSFLLQSHLRINKGFRKQPAFQNARGFVTAPWFHISRGFLFYLFVCFFKNIFKVKFFV
jgi:hypothetical protein